MTTEEKVKFEADEWDKKATEAIALVSSLMGYEYVVEATFKRCDHKKQIVVSFSNAGAVFEIMNNGHIQDRVIQNLISSINHEKERLTSTKNISIKDITGNTNKSLLMLAARTFSEHIPIGELSKSENLKLTQFWRKDVAEPFVLEGSTCQTEKGNGKVIFVDKIRENAKILLYSNEIIECKVKDVKVFFDGEFKYVFGTNNMNEVDHWGLFYKMENHKQKKSL